jgi:CheY-like chemotaxis protein
VQELAICDDRNLTEPGDQVLLIVEDDPTFARILVHLTRARGWRALLALRAGTRHFPGSRISARRHYARRPLAGLSGWTLLDGLKHDPQTAHIPVHVVSGHEYNNRGFALGAANCIPKDPSEESLKEIFATIGHSMDARKKTLLLIAENAVRRTDISHLLGGDNLDILEAEDLPATREMLASRDVDAIILDWVLQEEAGIELAIEFIGAVSRNPGCGCLR